MNRLILRFFNNRSKSCLSQNSCHRFPPPHTFIPAFAKYYSNNATPSSKIFPFILADIGEGTTEVEIIQWFVKQGDKIAQFDKLCEVQSDKAADNITSRFDGIIKKLHYKAGDMAIVGKPLVDIEVEGGEVESPAVTDKINVIAKTEDRAEENLVKDGDTVETEIVTTPAVRKLAKDKKVDLKKVVGTGKDGRILKEDVLSYITTSNLRSEFKPITTTKQPDVPTIADTPSETITPLTKIQKAMFKQMTKSLNIPHFGFTEEIEFIELIKCRAQINSHLSQGKDESGLKKITFMPFFIKALSLALEEYPLLNAMVVVDDDGAASLKYRNYHNIGFAMDTPAGLLVPNIKSVESKTIFQIAKELDRIRNAGSSQSSADLTGSTITLSNIGNIGGTTLHPVIVSTEVCIGALGRIQSLPRYDENGQIVKKEIMTVSFNADHRVVDGATMARFVKKWKVYLEVPGLMLLDAK